MAKNNKPNNNKNLKAPKFNFYWIYGIIITLILGYQFLNSGDLSSRNLSENEFKTILKANDISKIEIVNKDVANIYIKENSLGKDKYKKDKGSFYNSSMPLYSYDFGDLQNFEKELTTEKKENNLDFDTRNIEKTNFLDQIFVYLPFIFLIGLW
ncbi:MAG: ATP-dependent metallopeptidase FtsH/Yme1/Tma family protein, partial [Lutibacter sp.]